MFYHIRQQLILVNFVEFVVISNYYTKMLSCLVFHCGNENEEDPYLYEKVGIYFWDDSIYSPHFTQYSPLFEN